MDLWAILDFLTPFTVAVLLTIDLEKGLVVKS